MKKIKFICLIFICFLMFTLVACETDAKKAPTNEKTDMIMEGEKVSSRLASFEYEDYVNYVKVNFTSNDLETGPLKPNPYENKDELSSNDIINLALEELRIDYNNLIQEVNDELNKKIVVLTYEALKDDFNAHFNWGYCAKHRDKIEEAIMQFQLLKQDKLLLLP